MARKTKPLTDTEIKAAKPKDADCRFNWSTQQLCENMGLRR
ncbi:hypothetical protein, partial [Escherichia coli]